MKRNWVVALIAALLVVGVGLGATLTIRSANAAPRAAPLPVAYNGANSWHQGRARLPVIYIGQSNVFVRTPHWSRWSGSSAQTRGELWVTPARRPARRAIIGRTLRRSASRASPSATASGTSPG
ncbi:MAG: hypothetical protein ACTHPS_19580 [Streptosporangiaceae bacterium]